MREVILKTQGLTKRYRDTVALDHADLTVYRGDICGLIGKNGAGKTTLMKLVTGLTAKTEGEFSLFGKSGRDVRNEKKRIGCLIENPAFFGGMTAWQNLNYYAIQKGIADKKQIDEALSLVGLTEARNKKFRQFSLGMKQRLGVAFALLDNPDLVILDEPINGLDPIGIAALRDTFHRLNREKNITFMISSHILSELYLVADHFLFIDRGKILKILTKEELDKECMRCVAVRTKDTKAAVALIESRLGVTDYRVIDSGELRVYDEKVSAEELNRLFFENGIGVSSIYETGISLEDYFKSLVGQAQEQKRDGEVRA